MEKERNRSENGRRLKVERRKSKDIKYNEPERRTDKDRRTEKDRRNSATKQQDGYVKPEKKR